MYTSAIRHPKRSHYVSIHQWQLVATNGSIHASALLSALEEKFIQLICSERKDRTDRWLRFTRDEILKETFSKNMNEVTSALGILEAIGFIKTQKQMIPVSSSDPILIELDAVAVNQWIDKFQKPKTESQLINSPFASLFLMLAAINRPKVTGHTAATKAKAEELFEFWKHLTNHNRAKPSPKWLKMICDRMDNGYDEIDCAQALIGLTHSDHHMGRNGGPKYDGIKYVFGDTEKLDRMVGIAEQKGITRERAQERFASYFNNHEMPQLTSSFVNQSTGSILK
jgi:hypothetical protein